MKKWSARARTDVQISSKPKKTPHILRSLCTFALALVVSLDSGAVCHADGAPDNLRISLQSKDLTEALTDLSRAANVQFAFEAEDVRGLSGGAVSGARDVGAALRIILDGTGLEAEPLSPVLWRIVKRADTKTAKADASGVTEAVALPPKSIYVRGTRAALRSAQSQIRNGMDLQDIVVAEDIARLPDMNITESMQRMSGVQISRDMGEGTQVLVRGLPQVSVLLDGREVFSDSRRTLNLGALTTEGISQISLVKSPSARMVEGGIAGTVSIRTWEPFDFKGDVTDVTLREVYYNLNETARFQGAVLLSRRASTRSGEWGFLTEVALDPSAGRLDSIGIEPYTSRNDILPSDNSALMTTLAPHGAGNSQNIVRRQRTNLMQVVQWKGGSGLSAKLQLNHFDFVSRQDSIVVYANDGPMTIDAEKPFSVTPAGTLTSGTYKGVIVTVPNNYWDWTETLDQAALSGAWWPTASTTLTLDVSQTRSTRTNAYGGMRLTSIAGNADNRLMFDLRSGLPQLGLTGQSFADHQSWLIQDAGNWHLRATGAQTAIRVEGEIGFSGTHLRAIRFGGRVTQRVVSSQQGGISHLSYSAPVYLSSGLAPLIAVRKFMAGKTDAQLLGAGVPGVPVSFIRDTPAVCALLNDQICTTPWEPANSYVAQEATRAIYGSVEYAFLLMGVSISGDVSLRYVHTAMDINGVIANAGAFLPLGSEHVYSDLLPSANLLAELTPKIRFRLSAARQISRVDFDSLSPNLQVAYTGPNSFPVGNAGNPALSPLRSESFDVSLERFSGPLSMAYLTFFAKRVSGFLQTEVRDEDAALFHLAHLGSIKVARPKNGGVGDVTGAEIGGQTFLSALPVIGEGLGMKGNLTWSSSRSPAPLLGQRLPLVGFSPFSANVQLFYEKGDLSGRLAYTYRGGYLDTTSGIGSGFSPVFADSFGMMDLSLSRSFSSGVSVRLDISNLLRPVIRSHFEAANQPRFLSTYDQRIIMTVRKRL